MARFLSVLDVAQGAGKAGVCTEPLSPMASEGTQLLQGSPQISGLRVFLLPGRPDLPTGVESALAELVRVVASIGGTADERAAGSERDSAVSRIAHFGRAASDGKEVAWD